MINNIHEALNISLKKYAKTQNFVKIEIAFIKGYKNMLFIKNSMYEDEYSVKLRLALIGIPTGVTVYQKIYFKNYISQN